MTTDSLLSGSAEVREERTSARAMNDTVVQRVGWASQAGCATTHSNQVDCISRIRSNSMRRIAVPADRFVSRNLAREVRKRGEDGTC